MLTIDIVLLFVIFQLKHFLADYPLQTLFPSMLGKFLERGWAKPLAVHCLVHAAFTAAIALWFLTYAYHYRHPWTELQVLLVAGFDFGAHFIMDRVKAAPHLMGRWKALSKADYLAAAQQAACGSAAGKRALRGNMMHYNALGFDQLVHHLTHYVIIAFLLFR